MSILVGGHTFTNQMIMGILNELRANYSNANELVCNLRHQSIQALTDLLNKTENKTIDLSELDYDILVSKVTTPPLIDIAKLRNSSHICKFLGTFFSKKSISFIFLLQ